MPGVETQSHENSILKQQQSLLEHKVQGKGMVRYETRREITAAFPPFTENLLTE